MAFAATVMQRMNQREVGSVLFLDMAVEIFGTWEEDRTAHGPSGNDYRFALIGFDIKPFT